MYPTTYHVKQGDTLSQIAECFYGDGSRAAWERIYNVPSNRAVIGNDPNLIKPGQCLTIPFPCVIPPNCKYTTKYGDTLSSIAAHYYGDGTEPTWRKIYTANQGSIGPDPYTLPPNCVLTIPPYAP
jgi:nucleoid-associated protein YgaU